MLHYRHDDGEEVKNGNPLGESMDLKEKEKNKTTRHILMGYD